MKIKALNKKTNRVEEIVEPGIRICNGELNGVVIPICGKGGEGRKVCLSTEWYMCEHLIRYKPIEKW